VQQKASAETFATIFVAVNAPAWQMIGKRRVAPLAKPAELALQFRNPAGQPKGAPVTGARA
jgi:hypothetical protein